MKRTFLLLATISIFFATLGSAWAVSEIDLYFPPQWHDHPEAATRIADKLGQEIAIKVVPHITVCYPEIITALSQEKPVLAYVGSMVQMIVMSRKLGVPLLQALDHKQYYGGVLLYPKGSLPSAILNNYPVEIVYTVGTTSGEVCAKAATGGRAWLAVSDQHAAVDLIKDGKAKAAFVKNTWWEENRDKYPEFDSYSVPGVSDLDNADNVLLASNFVSHETRSLIMNVAANAPDIFNADLVIPFDSFSHWYTKYLMNKAGIDPLTYTWPSGLCMEKAAARPAPPTPAPPTPTPAPPVSASWDNQTLLAGEALLKENCRKCHLIEKVKKYRKKTKEQWQSTIIRKRNVGVELTEKEQSDLISYLLSLKRNKKQKSKYGER